MAHLFTCPQDDPVVGELKHLPKGKLCIVVALYEVPSTITEMILGSFPKMQMTK